MQERSISRPFSQVDVFTSTAYLGNPLAVVLDGSGLTDAEMQQFARWTNLAETTFLLPPTPEAAAQGADYQVRIFTTAYEMPFAGHPTLGSCHAWLAQGGVPRDPEFIVQQSKVGLVRIRRTLQGDTTRLAFAAPRLTRSPLAPEHHSLLCKAFGLPEESVIASQHLCNGPQHIGLLLGGDDAADTILALNPDFHALNAALQTIGATGAGVVGRTSQPDSSAPLIRRSNREARAFGGATKGAADTNLGAIATPLAADLEVRFFATGVTFAEDPVTGSFNASTAQWLMAEGHMPESYIASQGACVGSAGVVYLERDAAAQVWVGGDVVTCINGSVLL